jgi:hypothetical protein
VFRWHIVSCFFFSFSCISSQQCSDERRSLCAYAQQLVLTSVLRFLSSTTAWEAIHWTGLLWMKHVTP